MDNLLKILQISDIDVIDYVNDKIINLSFLKSNKETISLGDNGVIYYG